MGKGQRTEGDSITHEAHRVQARKTAEALGIPLAPDVQEYLAPAPDLPMEGFYLWQWFADLHACRTSSGFGLNPITFTEIQSWASLYRIPVSIWEVNILRKLDNTWLNEHGRQQRIHNTK